MEQTMGVLCPCLEAHEIGRSVTLPNLITFLPIINFYRLETNVLTEESSLGVCE